MHVHAYFCSIEILYNLERSLCTRIRQLRPNHGASFLILVSTDLQQCVKFSGKKEMITCYHDTMITLS
jgi:hypothetical protein